MTSPSYVCATCGKQEKLIATLREKNRILREAMAAAKRTLEFGAREALFADGQKPEL